ICLPLVYPSPRSVAMVLVHILVRPPPTPTFPQKTLLPLHTNQRNLVLNIQNENSSPALARCLALQAPAIRQVHLLFLQTAFCLSARWVRLLAYSLGQWC